MVAQTSAISAPLARAELSKVFQNPRVRAEFENLFSDVTGTLPNAINAILANAIFQEQITGDTTGATDSSATLEAAAGPSGTLQQSGFFNADFVVSGTYLLSNTVDLSPDVNLDMDGRGQVILVPGNNLPALTANYSGQTYGAGAPSALFRSARIAPAPGANHSRATYQLWRGFNVDFTGTVQANTVSAFRTPNPNPVNNSFDADPNYTTNKVYTAGTLEYVEIWAPSGDGWTIESGNGRAYVHSSRVLNAGGNGYNFGANDVVMAGHWAAGGCLGFGIKAGQDAGFWATSGNIWGNSANRSVSCGAMWLFNRKLFGVQNCEFNDWLRMDGGNGTAGNQGFYRGGVLSGNVFAPFASNFVSDGVAIDTTAGGPDSRLQANVGITGYQSGAFYGNVHTRTDKTSFTTPYNSGGWGGPGTLGYVAADTTGTYGTAPAYLYDVGANAIVVIDDAISTAPNVKPWCNTNPSTASYNDPVPIYQHSSGQALYRFRDGYTGIDRSGARGVQYHFMLGVSETAFPSTTYSGELGDASQYLRYTLNGMWEHQRPVQFQASAWLLKNASAGSTFSVAPSKPQEIIDCNLQGNTYTSGTVTLLGGLNASQKLRVKIRNGTCPSITWTTTTSAIDQSMISLPTSISSSITYGYVIEFWYDATNDLYRVDSISGSLPVAGGSSGSVQYNNGGLLYGDSGFTYSNSTYTLTLGPPTASTTITNVAPTSIQTPGSISISGQSATGSTISGAAVSLTAGAGNTSGNGGSVTITSGAGGNTTGTSGVLAISVGSSSSHSGALTITGGASSATLAAGAVTITGGANSSTGAGGTVTIKSGASTSGPGGTITLNGGTGSTTGGSFSIRGGIGGTSTGGGLSLFGGNSTSGTGGSFSMAGGTSTSATGGSVTIAPGTGGVANGTVSINAGAGGTVIQIADNGTNAELGFFAATPVPQPTTSIGSASFTANSGTAINSASTFDGYTIAQVVKALRNLGQLA